MERKVFAMKIPRIEKDAMEFTARRTGKTLTILYYRGLQKTLHEVLGAVLLQQLDPRMDVVDMALNGENLDKIPPIINEVIEILDRSEKEEFKKIFYNIKPVDIEDVIQELDLLDMLRYLGSRYLAEVGQFDYIAIDAVEAMLYDYILYLYYKLSAVGSLRSLEKDWHRNRHKLETLKQNIMKIRHEKYGGVVVTPIRVENTEKGSA